jgi:ABC-type uncharacterized transport system permease subunit
LRRIGESSPAVWVLASTTTAVLLYLAANAVFFSVRAGNALIGIYGIVVVASIVYTLALKAFAPTRLRAVGIYDETQRADLLSAAPFR